MNAVQTLYDFIDGAKKDRKYADNTVGGFKAALKLFESSLNEDEKASLDTLQNNLSSIAEDVYAKNKDKFSSNTINTYRRRINGLIKDYKQYGGSPSKMAAWNPRRNLMQTTKKNTVKNNKRKTNEAEIIDLLPSSYLSSNGSQLVTPSSITTFDSSGAYRELNRSEVYIREGLKVSLELPIDITRREADKLKQFIDVMVMDE